MSKKKPLSELAPGYLKQSCQSAKRGGASWRRFRDDCRAGLRRYHWSEEQLDEFILKADSEFAAYQEEIRRRKAEGAA